MKLAYRGIHKNVGFIVQHVGGYDKEYHIKKLSEELNISIETMTMLFKEAPRSNLLHYIDLLRVGVSIEEVFKMVDEDNRISTARVRSLFGVMGTLFSNGWYHP